MFQQAIVHYQKAIEINPADYQDEPVVLYNVACFYAHAGDKERSLYLLESAVDKGWGDKAWLETDSDLGSLRDLPRFQTLLDGID